MSSYNLKLKRTLEMQSPLLIIQVAKTKEYTETGRGIPTSTAGLFGGAPSFIMLIKR